MVASSRYFFNLVSDHEVICDEEGINLSLDDIPTCTLQAIAELKKEDPFSSRDWQGWQLEVIDSLGQIVLSFSLGHAEKTHFIRMQNDRPWSWTNSRSPLC